MAVELVIGAGEVDEEMAKVMVGGVEVEEDAETAKATVEEDVGMARATVEGGAEEAEIVVEEIVVEGIVVEETSEVVGVPGETVDSEGEVEGGQLISSGIFPKIISLYKFKLSVLTFPL